MNIQHICVYHPSLSAIGDPTILLFFFFLEGGGGGVDGAISFGKYLLY